MESFANHSHKAVRIADVAIISEVSDKWTLLKENYEKIYDVARPKFKTMKTLIDFIEAVYQNNHQPGYQHHNLSIDYNRLSDVTKEI
jgi:hypothetical protein